MDLSISCAFATSPTTPDDIVLAEHLGYDRAWCYDSPALYPDVWMTLALAADRTERIGLGPAVLVPNLRHPMTNAAAIATLVGLAPGRVAVAIGSGFTGRFTLGQQPLRWADVQAYVEAVRGLLRGEAVEWEGAPMQMLHPDSFAPKRPIEVPIYIGAEGRRAPPSRTRSATASSPPCSRTPTLGASRRRCCASAPVLDPGESHTNARVLEAAGARSWPSSTTGCTSETAPRSTRCRVARCGARRSSRRPSASATSRSTRATSSARPSATAPRWRVGPPGGGGERGGGTPTPPPQTTSLAPYSWTSSMRVPKAPLGWTNATVVPRSRVEGPSSMTRPPLAFTAASASAQSATR